MGGGGGYSHIKTNGGARCTFEGLKGGLGTSQSVQPQKVHSGSYCGTFAENVTGVI